jgi:transposase InsO family protein
MISLEDRRQLARDIDTAHAAGARLDLICEIAGIDVRTLQRWKAGKGLELGDGRPLAVRPTPAHALTPLERDMIVQVANEPRFADKPPARIVPAMADEGIYLASESSFQRVLRERRQTAHRGRAKLPRKVRPPTTHVATAPRQVWCWDVTYLPALILGHWFYLYLILDIFSRKIVGFEVHATDDGEHAALLLKRTALAESLHAVPVKPVLHGDNGPTVKCLSVKAMLDWLKISPSYSRPRVSDDNPFVESLFRTAKYRPEFPSGGFPSREAAQKWAAEFVSWYNNDHLHSGIRYISPASRHVGQDHDILEARHRLYSEAKQRNPRRWSGNTRNWTPVAAVTLNPERETVVAAKLRSVDENRQTA